MGWGYSGIAPAEPSLVGDGTVVLNLYAPMLDSAVNRIGGMTDQPINLVGKMSSSAINIRARLYKE